ncbi:MAG TPA: TIGR00730 family Rossman fold protein [Proteiniphilum sp.]|nr:TIGR00730 family Rossman fold protein [Proteiniphilum sp.]HPD86372.1 TIGR00730 family Rossman fold protein [Proteiniphilum sp.]HPJ49608.1 TIGR00730 family Rossman fold protein [Proteiniphilum sp.]HPR19903.1 TIGR00730 family Rossman fold protein [Proteiniphilum sp.]
MRSEKNSDYNVVVYCASSNQLRPVFTQAATRLGELLAQNGITCVNGAGKEGLMGALNDAVLQHGGRVKGIIPRFMSDAGWGHDELTELVVTETIHERKALMADTADAVVALPGGMGTLEELAEILTWKQLGLSHHPIILLNVDHYYDPLLAFFDKMISERFMSDDFRRMWLVADTPEEVISMLQNYPEWNPTFGKYTRKEL